MIREPHFDFERLLNKRYRQAAQYERPSAGSPTAISFYGGLADPDSFPFNALVGTMQRVMRQEGRAALQYGDLLGYAGLRDLLANRIGKTDGVALLPENVAITHGSIAALALICFTFLDPGDLVIVEAPTYMGALRLFRLHEAEIAAVPLDNEGLQTKALARLLAKLKLEGRTPKLLYTMPTFQNPTGATMAIERRLELLELAHQFGFLVVEDDAYGELRYEGERIPSLLTLDKRGLVFKTGTLSKLLAPGLRLGWLCGPADVITRLALTKPDGGTAPFASRLVAEYLRMGLLESHTVELVRIYRNKRDTILAALTEYCAPDCKWSRPSGGFFVWLELPPAVDPVHLYAEAQAFGVTYLPGRFCYQDNSGDHHIRLAFSYLNPSEITEGVKRLSRCIERVRRS